MKQILGMLPGVGSSLKDINIDDKELDRVEAQIQSMTVHERKKPKLIDNSRKRRIARGAGVDQATVGKLVKQFNTINQLTRGMGDMSARSKMSTMTHMAQGAGGSADAAAAASMMPSIARKKGTAAGKPKGFKQRKKRK